MRKVVSIFWKENPFIRILIPFLIGIPSGFYGSFFLPLWLFLSLAGLLTLCRIHFFPAWKAWKWGYMRGIAINLLLFISGATTMIAKNNYPRNNHNNPTSISGKRPILAFLEEPSILKNKRTRAVVSIFEILPGYRKKNLGKAILYFPPKENSKQMTYGSWLMIHAKIERMQKIGNPWQFDYVSWYARQGIFYQVFLREYEYLILPGNKGNFFNHLLFSLRDRTLQVLETFIKDKQAAGLAEALLIGYRNNLDPDLLTAYSNTGVVHVIAVSGLHLGLLFSVFMTLTSLGNRNNKRNWIQFVLIIPFLWIFCMIAGGAASVIRSACMYTLLTTGQVLGKKSIPLNTLFGAAFILLAFQPGWILDIGFQLSFAAVASIMLYYESIRKWLHFRNPLAIKCWEMIALTLSAQILTTPVILFYFMQFPLLFLFTNLVAVPLSGWILLGELVLCISSFWTGLAHKIGTILEKAIGLLNGYIIQMDHIPFSVIHNLYISPLQLITLYSCIAGFTFWMTSKNKAGFWLMLFSLLAFTAIQLDNSIYKRHQKQLLIFSIPGQQGIMLIKGNIGYMINYNEKKGNKIKREKEKTAMMGYYKLSHIVEKNLPGSTIVWIKWEGKTILLCRRNAVLGYSQQLSGADICVLSENTAIGIETLLFKTDCQYWVADGTNAMWKIQEWKKEADQLHLRFHSVKESGAFIRDLSENGPAIIPPNPGFTPE